MSIKNVFTGQFGFPRFPNEIPQSQPQQFGGIYYQQNFPQQPLSLNASLHNPRVQVLTSPWRTYSPENHGHEEESNRPSENGIKIGYKLDYGRTNPEINHWKNKEANKYSKIKQLDGNNFINIVNPEEQEITIYDNISSNNSDKQYYSSTYSPDNNYYSSTENYYNNSDKNEIITEHFTTNNSPYLYSERFNNVEHFNTPRPSNKTSGDLNGKVFYSPNTETNNNYNRPIKQLTGNYQQNKIGSEYEKRIPLNITIYDNSDDLTYFSNKSYENFNCPLKQEIADRKKNQKTNWSDLNDSENDPVNREKFRRELHRKYIENEKFKETCISIKSKNETVQRSEGKKEESSSQTNNSENNTQNDFTENVTNSKTNNSSTVNKDSFISRRTEKFECENQSNLDEMYKHILEARANAIITYVMKDPSFRPWIYHWNLMQKNISKCNLDFNRLEDNHEDVAYSLDKGKELSFRFRDREKYLPLSVESYILVHEMAHTANEEIGHGDKFQELMHLLEVAAYMLQFIDLTKYPANETIFSNGQEILSRDSIKYELADGIKNLIKFSATNPEQQEYWQKILERVKHNK